MKVMIDMPKEAFELIKSDTPIDFLDAMHIISAFKNGILLSENHERKFEEIVVEYLPDKFCMYPEYKGKPYFSIKYEENGRHIIGYGTYDPEVLSGYLRDYFIAPTIEADNAAENDTDKPCKNMMKNDYIFNRVSITNVKKSYASIKGRDYE